MALVESTGLHNWEKARCVICRPCNFQHENAQYSSIIWGVDDVGDTVL